MKVFEDAARDAGRALGDCGAGEGSAIVEEVARALAEIAGEPPARRRRRGSAGEARNPERARNPDDGTSRSKAPTVTP